MRLSILLALLGTVYTVTAQRTCNKVDIVFIMDGSGSIGGQNFLTQLDFIKYIVNQFQVGPNAVQFGLIKFSTRTDVEFKLNTFANKGDILNKLDRVLYYGGGTKIGLALNEARAKMFTPSAGRRAGVPTVGIVITDGRSTDSVVQPAQALRANYIELFAIGIGKGANIPELNEIATRPSSTHVHTVDSFNGLQKIQDLLVKQYCAVTAPPPTQTPLPSRPPLTFTDAPKTQPTNPPSGNNCAGGKVDIVFALDSSGSISLQDYGILKTFVEQMVRGFSLGANKVRVGMLRFSDKVTEQLKLKDSFNLQNVINQIKVMQYDGTGTKTHLAINHMRTVSFTQASGARAGVPKVALIITDGNSNQPHLTEQESNELKKLGVKVFAIGVGSKITQAELNRMASTPKRNHVFSVSSYKDLSSIRSQLNKQTCGQGSFTGTFPPPTTTPAPTGCVDVDATCGQLGANFCTDYAPWAKVNCAATCKFCTPTGTTPNAGPCADLLSDCASYGANLCSDARYTQFVKTNCRCHCKLCSCASKGTAPPKPTATPKPAVSNPGAGGCRNVEANCESYGKNICTDYKGWATTNCAQFCGFCTGGVVTPAPACVDAISDCKSYGANICTSSGFEQWVRTNCRKFCNRC